MRRSLFSFPIHDDAAARVAVRRAAIAGWIAAGLTALVVGLALSSGRAVFGAAVDAWGLVDAGVMAALALGTYRGYRFAAVGLLGLYVFEQIALRVGSGEVGGLLIALLFVLLFVHGVRGTFFLHRAEQDRELVAQIEALEAGPEAGEAA